MAMTMTGYKRSNIFSFCQTVQGKLHIERGLPCEDASGSWSSESGQVHIIAVADGHGSSSCFRSKGGAFFAVESAVDCFRKFAAPLERGSEEGEAFLDQFSSEKKCTETVRRLVDIIVNNWYEKVEQDLAAHPITEEVLLQNPCNEEDMADYRKGNNLVQIYGSTLLAALYIPDYLILIQKGDGHCVVFYEDGSVEEPVPWDDRCHQNVTTSLCQPDAAETTQFYVISLRDKPFAACFLGCDGVEDSFTDLEGTEFFYKELCGDFINEGKTEFLRTLPGQLQRLSAKGSGDDVSVAAILNCRILRKLQESFVFQTELYNLRKKYRKYEERNDSMKKKYEYLKRKVQEQEEELKDLSDFSSIQQVEAKREELEDKRHALDEYAEQYKKHLVEYQEIKENLFKLENRQEEHTDGSYKLQPVPESDVEVKILYIATKSKRSVSHRRKPQQNISGYTTIYKRRNN